MEKLCNCGSGLHRYALVDAAGIFCAFVCDKCEETKRAKFRPEVFNGNHPYASSGDESLLDIDWITNATEDPY